MSYRKWSVPADLVSKIKALCVLLGYTKKGDRWKLIERLVAYATEHPSIFTR